ncbi:MAG: hypothetical protein ACXWP0_04375 [Ktedonobacterales bacterium]
MNEYFLEASDDDAGWVYSLAEGRRWVLARMAEIHAKPSRQEGDTVHDLWNTTPLEIEHIDEVLAVLLDEGIIMQEQPGIYTLA